MKYLLLTICLLFVELFPQAQTNVYADNITQQSRMDSLQKVQQRLIDSALTMQRLKGFDLGVYTIAQDGALLAIPAGTRYITLNNVTGLLATDDVLIRATSDLPANVKIEFGERVMSAGVLRIPITAPAIALLSPGYSFTIRIIALRR